MSHSDTVVRHTFYPFDNDDLLKVIYEAKENGLRIKYFGGAFPANREGADILISLSNMRNSAHNPEAQLFTFEGGMTLSEVLQSLEYLNFTLELYGIIPNMTVADAISVGLTGSNGSIASCLKSCQVFHSDGALANWVWSNPNEVSERIPNIPGERDFVPTLHTLVCGLGVVGIINNATLKCIPIHLAQEMIYMKPLDEILNNWQQLSDALYGYIYWYPLLDKVVVNHATSVRLHLGHFQPWWKKCIEMFYWGIHWLINRSSPYLAWYAPSFTRKLSQIQFSLILKALSYRKQYSFRPQLLISVGSYCRGIEWSLPAEKLQDVVEDIVNWAEDRFYLCSTPIVISLQTHHTASHQQPYLCPYTERKTCTFWTDWFNSKTITSSYSAAMAEFEALLQKNGGRKSWSAGPVYASPLIGQMYPGYRRWCETRAILDPDNTFKSAYVAGDLLVER